MVPQQINFSLGYRLEILKLLSLYTAIEQISNYIGILTAFFFFFFFYCWRNVETRMNWIKIRRISMNSCVVVVFNICVDIHILSCTVYLGYKWWHHSRNEHTKTPFFKGTRGSSLKKWLLPGLGQRKYKINLEYLIAPENQKLLKKWIRTR